MGSLTAHLVEAGDHGRLGFHPGCPVCRDQRLLGALSSEPVVSRRAQAVLVGGVLAFSTAAPGAVLAREPDRRDEGLVAPDQPGGGEAGDPGFDPGGETALPFETNPVAPRPVEEGGDLAPHADGDEDQDLVPLEVEPEEDLDARLVPPSEPDALAVEESAPVPPADPVVPGEPTVPTDPTLAPTQPAPPAAEPLSPGGTDRAPKAGRPDSRADRPAPRDPRHHPAANRVDRSVSAETIAGTPAVAPSEPAEAQQGALAEPSAAPAGDTDTPLHDARFYVVAPGDSLWSIAKRMLGREASVARIAREVDRLWSLNGDRIATGDPDLLMVGTRLRLR